MDNKKIIQHVSAEYQSGYEHVRKKREIRRKQLGKYVESTEGAKIQIHKIYAQMKTFMSIFHSNDRKVQFLPNKTLDEEFVEKMNKVAEADRRWMKLNIVDYEDIWNSGMMWVGVRLLEGWNQEKGHPIAKAVNPLCCIPDPQWGWTIDSHRFFGFELQMTKHEMKQAWFTSVHLVTGEESEEQKKTRQNTNKVRWYGVNSHDKGGKQEI